MQVQKAIRQALGADAMVSRVWRIRGTTQPDEKYQFVHNREMFVVADRLEDAIAVARAKHPGLTLYAINDMGAKELMVHPEAGSSL